MTAEIPIRKRIRIAHLYPEAMDLYGDIGNVIVLQRRCEWRGIDAEILEVRADDASSLDGVDLIVMGGGQDSAEAYVVADLLRRGPEIRQLIDDGAAALVICGGLQLFGRSYETASGEELEGIGVFDARTTGGPRRLIGNIAIEASVRLWGAGGAAGDSAIATADGTAKSTAPETIELVGFENHSGVTRLGSGTEPLGRVIRGAGNLGDGSIEGAVYRNAIGTYLHGPLLPKNPALADHLITAALAHRYGAVDPLTPLDDNRELDAHRAAVARCYTGRVAELTC